VSDYYRAALAAERLRRCYDVAPPRVRQYLEAEISFVIDHLQPGDSVLDLGCGFGRVIPRLMTKAHAVIGVDTSLTSLRMASENLSRNPSVDLVCASAAQLPLAGGSVNVTICIQNGISAFHIDREQLLCECIRVTARGGLVLISSYAASFWVDRLHWFQLQADAGLIGEIDEAATGDGVIVCKDGFSATTVTVEEFTSLTRSCGYESRIQEVDQSSLFCVIALP